MKLNKLLLKTIILLFFIGSLSPAFCEENHIEGFTGASTKNHYTKTSLKGDVLMNVIKKHEAGFVLSTTNPDNSPNAGVFIPGVVSDSSIKFGLAKNQTLQNIERTKKAVLTIYRFLPKESGKQCHQGARILLELDEEKSMKKKNHSIIIMTIKEILPLG